MKTGIIIACYEEDGELNREAFIKFGQRFNQYHFCFVNIGNSAQVSVELYGIKRHIPENCSIVNVKKNARINATLKAGYRYLHSRKDIEFIGYIEGRFCDDFDSIVELVKKMEDNNDMSEVMGTDGQRTGRINYKNLPGKLIEYSVAFLRTQSILMNTIYNNKSTPCLRYVYVTGR